MDDLEENISAREKDETGHPLRTNALLRVILVEVPVPISAGSCLSTLLQGEQRRNP
jgi:hypothetical protein